jgi:hypothetical protein
MVYFMDVRVDEFKMQKSMRTMKAHILANHAKYYLAKKIKWTRYRFISKINCNIVVNYPNVSELYHW